MKVQAIVTRESLQNLLDREDHEFVAKVVGRALVSLMQNQTEAEKMSNATSVDNGIGFTGADAYSATLTAKSFMKKGTLADWQVAKWTKKGKSGFSRLTKYHRQLNEIALAKRGLIA